MANERKYNVVLDDIVWDIEGYEFEEEHIVLPERMEFAVWGYDEDDAVYRAMDEASNETGWLLYASHPTVTTL